jgi:hypothetical protein
MSTLWWTSLQTFGLQSYSKLISPWLEEEFSANEVSLMQTKVTIQENYILIAS